MFALPLYLNFAAKAPAKRDLLSVSRQMHRSGDIISVSHRPEHTETTIFLHGEDVDERAQKLLAVETSRSCVVVWK